MGQGDRRGFSFVSATPGSPQQDAPMPRPRAGRGPPDPGKCMVGRVHTGNGITRYGTGAYTLIGGDGLSDRGNVSGREWGSGVIEGKQRYWG